MPTDLDLTPFDIAVGRPYDERPPSARAVHQERPETPAEALEAVVLDALRRPPCVVSFSGGRDSSVILAAAARAARRHGLPLPVPASFVFPAAPRTVETEWQERVIDHLGLEDWRRVDRPEDLDYLGPAAQATLGRHGLLYPANIFWQRLTAEHARGGTLLTGAGGDEVLGLWRWQRVGDVLARRVRPQPRDFGRIVLAASPGRARVALHRRRVVEYPWLRPAAQSRLTALLARQQASEPRSWSRRVAWLSRQRYLRHQRRALAAVAGDFDAAAGSPFSHPRVVAAVAAAGGVTGLGSRSDALGALFGDLLPADVLERRTKATFEAVWMGERTREFVEGWQGEGVDPELVDVARLQELWRGPRSDARSALLLHRAWLETTRQGVDECSTPKS